MARLGYFVLLFFLLPHFSYAQEHAEHAVLAEALTNSARYVCPMHNHIVKDHPGNCPICGMDLVAAEQKTQQQPTVNVSGAMQQAMALTTEKTVHSRLWRFINTFGTVQFDETSLNHIHPRAAGWIEKLRVNALGQQVSKGELLYEIYAPDLLVAQQDFLSLLSSKQATPVLLQRGRQRLNLLGFSQQLVAQLEQKRDVFYRVPYYAPQSGIVSALNIREGMYIQPSDSLMTIADLSQVWLVADVFQQQLDWVAKGQPIEVDLPALNLFGLEGQVEFIYPTLDPITRTLQLRLRLDNPEQKLKPNMLAKVRIYAGPITALNIPTSALIQTEKHNRIFVQTDKGSFERRDVEVGIISQGRAEIRHGLKLGDKVVTSGQFLLDAEASLSNVAMDQTTKNTHAQQHQHQH